MATLTVGSGKQYSSIQAAVGASASGDTIAIDAGTYTIPSESGIPSLGTKNLTIKGVGGIAKVVANGWVWNEKGIFIARGNVTFDHIHLDGATSSSGNCGGIRWEGGNLTCVDCIFTNNQNGILGSLSSSGTPTDDGTVTLLRCEFHHNGNPNGGAGTHNIYINNCKKLLATDCYFHEVTNGYHLLKSRAENTELVNCRFFDLNAQTGYDIDIPSGGICTVRNCVVQQGPNSGNSNILSFGAEDSRHSVHKMTLDNNVFVNDKSNGTLLFNPQGFQVVMTDNDVWKAGSLTMPSGSWLTQSGTTTLSSRPTLDTSSPVGAAPPVDPEEPPVDPEEPPVEPTPGAGLEVDFDCVVTVSPATSTPALAELVVSEDGMSADVVLTQGVVTQGTVTQTRKVKIHLEAMGVKASQFATRVAVSAYGNGGSKITVDGTYSVMVAEYPPSNFTVDNFTFAPE